MKKSAFLLVATLTMLLFTSVYSEAATVSASKKIVSRTENYTGFTKVSVGYAMTLYLTQANEESIKIEAGDNVIDKITCKMDGDKLVFGIKPSFRSLNNTNVKIYVSSKSLSELDVSGASAVYMNSSWNVPALSFKLSGASNAVIDNLSCGNCEAVLSGASFMKLNGVVNSFDVKASGASFLKASGKAVDSNCSLSGASRCNAFDFVINHLSADLSGASSMKITAREISLKASGASHLNCNSNTAFIKKDLSGGASVSVR